MFDFDLALSTQIYFGKKSAMKLRNVLEKLNKENVMLIYGEGSIKKMECMKKLKDN